MEREIEKKLKRIHCTIVNDKKYNAYPHFLYAFIWVMRNECTGAMRCGVCDCMQPFLFVLERKLYCYTYRIIALPLVHSNIQRRKTEYCVLSLLPPNEWKRVARDSGAAHNWHGRLSIYLSICVVLSIPFHLNALFCGLNTHRV